MVPLELATIALPYIALPYIIIKKTSTITGKMHPTMKNVSLISSNLVCAITCQICSMQYVGQTLLHLQDMFVGHYGDIKCDDHTKFQQPISHMWVTTEKMICR